MLQKIKELYAVVAGPHLGEPRMFMKTNEIVEVTWNVAENKRVVRKQALNISEIKQGARFASGGT